jgi:hypothetical protein
MSRSRAVRSAFSTIFAQPAIYFGEAMWRGAFAVTAWALCAFAFVEVLEAIPVTNRDAFGLSGALPALFPVAVRHVFTGTGALLFQTAAVLVLLIAALWWVASSMGRMAVLPALVGRNQRVTTVIALHFVRAVFAAAAALAYLGLAIFAIRFAATTPGRVYALAILMIVIISVLWSSVSWYLTLAPIMAARNCTGLVDSLLAATDIARSAAWQFTWIAFVFWSLRLLLAGFTASLFFSLGAMVAQLPPFALLMALLMTAIVYALFSFLLQAARLAAYVRVIDWSAAVHSTAV